MIEFRPVGPGLYARAMAGDAYNTAVYLARSLEGRGEVAFLTAVGDETLSAEIRSEIVSQGLDDALVFPVENALPGLYVIELDAAGDRSFHYWRSASAARRWFRELQAGGGVERLAGIDLLYLSGISLAILSPEDRAGALALLKAAKGRVGRIAFDPNVRPRLWPDMATAREAVEAAVALSDIVLPSEVDGRLIWGEAEPRRQVECYARLGPAEVVLTCGADDAWLRTGEGLERLAAPVAQVVDTSGAGDSFNAGYLAGRLEGKSPSAAAQAGLDLAARVVTGAGALIPREASHPSRQEPTPSASSL